MDKKREKICDKNWLFLKCCYINAKLLYNTLFMQEVLHLKIFAWLDRNTIEYIVSNCKRERFTMGDIIITQWDASNGQWYIIESGNVWVTVNGTKVAELGNGEIFWEIALLNEEERTATVTALSDVTCIVLSQDDLFEIINNGNESINKDIMERIEANLTLNND